MEKRFKLDKAAYGKSDTVRVYCKYVKGKGYCAYCELVETNICDDYALFGKSFCKEYYQSGGDMCDLVEPCNRKSRKNEQVATEFIMDNAYSYADVFVRNVANNLCIDLKIEREVR